MKQRREQSPAERAKQLKIAYGATFNSEAGKLVLRDIMEFCHMWDSSFIQGKGDATFFREGERNVGLMILNQLAIRDIQDLQEYAEVD